VDDSWAGKIMFCNMMLNIKGNITMVLSLRNGSTDHDPRCFTHCAQSFLPYYIPNLGTLRNQAAPKAISQRHRSLPLSNLRIHAKLEQRLLK
jgi:predicted component of type VI protein secretion system